MIYLDYSATTPVDKRVLDTFNKERDRQVKLHDINTKLKIAKENKNRYDVKKKK